MSGRRKRALALFVVFSVVVALLAVGRGSLASGSASAGWRDLTANPASRPLVSAEGGSAAVALSLRVRADEAALIVSAAGREVQSAPVSSIAANEPFAAFVVTTTAGTETLVGLARDDVAHVLLWVDGAAVKELPLNPEHAFSAADLQAGKLQLQAIAADGSTIGMTNLPTGAPACGAPGSSCAAAAKPPSPADLEPASDFLTVATTRVAGNYWRLRTYTSQSGASCVQLNVGHAAKERSCPLLLGPTAARPVWGAAGHSQRSGRAGWNRVWVYGHEGAAARVTLVRECATEQVSFGALASSRRWFLLVYTAHELRAGGLPRELIARDAGGKIVEDTHISLGTPRGALPRGERSCSTRVRTSAPGGASGTKGAIPRAFLRAPRAADALPKRFRFHLALDTSGRIAKIIDSRRIASYTDARGRHALLYLLRTKSQLCYFTFWNHGAGGGCGSIGRFFGTNHLVVGSGHLLSGVADKSVASVVVVGSRGVRHRVALSADGGFIFDCKAYNGCICVVDHIEAFDPAGALIERMPLGRCRKTQSAATRRNASQAARGYTIANRGRPIASRGRARLFGEQSYKLFLLGTAGGTAFYRVEVTPHFTCWGAGNASKIGELGSSGCPALVGAYPLQFDDNSVQLARGAKIPQTLRLDGIVVDQAASVALEDQHGKVLASVTPQSNLYSFPAPFPAGALRVVPLDAQGKPLPPQRGEHQTPPPNLFGPRAHATSPSALGQIVQRGEARGVTVAADQKGIVVFDTHSMDTLAKRELGAKQAYFDCFQIDAQNLRHVRQASIYSALNSKVALKMTVKARYDGCEIGGSYGHRWRDSHGAHTTVEIPLTAKGGRYFDARATARDLAAFVRSAKTQALRHKTGIELKAALRSAYANSVTFLGAPDAVPPAGALGVWASGTRTIFAERGHLGGRFFVQLDDGKITHENVRGFALVF